MEKKVQKDQFIKNYPRETAEQYYQAALLIQKECEFTAKMRSDMEKKARGASQIPRRPFQITNTPQPPSWADLGDNGREQRQQQMTHQPYQNQPPLPWQEPCVEQDVFSTMGHWDDGITGKPAKPRFQQQQQQYGRNTFQFNQPEPIGPKTDVFSNIGQWTATTVPEIPPPPKVETMQLDLSAPTPPPTFQPYPPKTHSLASPTTSSMNSSEVPETNSWKSLEFLLNLKPSRSPSLSSSGTKSPTGNFGQWPPQT